MSNYIKNKSKRRKLGVYVKDAPNHKVDVEVTDNLYERIQSYIESHEDMDVSKLVRAAVHQFLESNQ